MNRGLTGVKVGDTLIIPTGRNNEPREFDVTRVGRKYLYVMHYGRDWKFEIETGGEVTNYGAAVTARTLEQHADHAARQALMQDLHLAGVDFTYGHKTSQNLTNDHLRAILDIVRPDAAA
jgi:hypothetical protein